MGYFSSCNADSALAICDSQTFVTNRPNKPFKIREFNYDDLAAATNAFSAETLLGKGSHGSVYKAVLNNGHLVAAVKKTKLPNKTTTSFGKLNCTTCAENEIEILSRVRHPRLVNIIGFCPEPKNGTNLIVVEYMPNGTLHDMLHSRSRPPGWTRRVRLSLHVSKAVEGLHSSHPPVIHRDIVLQRSD